MRYIAFYILSILTIDLCAQSVELPPDSIIKKNHIKTITSFFNDDSIKNELFVVWKFDVYGNLISRQLFNNGDTTLSMDVYFYKDNLISESWRIGTWLKYDTVRTTYIYDNLNRKIKETTKGKFNPFKGKSNGFINHITYTYLNDSIVLKKYEGNTLTARSSGMDSMVYNKDKTLRVLFNKENDLKYIYTYNSQKQMLSEVQTSISTPEIINRYSKYVYENGRLIKEITGNSTYRNKEKYTEQMYVYTYDNNGLLKKLKRPFTFDTYVYEYYK